MVIELTQEQQLSLQRGKAVSFTDPATGAQLVVLRDADYTTIAEMLEEERARKAIASVGIQTAAKWAQDNPY
jgi:hypothetical protein